jgi:hypothetical protein
LEVQGQEGVGSTMNNNQLKFKTMDGNEFLEKADKANEDFIKSNNLSQETKSLGNKLMLISVLLLFTSLKLITLDSTVELNGINVKFEKDIC